MGKDDGDDSTTSYGVDAKANAKNTSAFGNKAEAVAENASAFGQNAKAKKENATAIGQDAKATQENASAIGQNATASGTNSSAVGQDASATARNATAVGQSAKATGRNSTAIGQGAKAEGKHSVAIGQGSVATRDNEFSVGSESRQRVVSNVAKAQRDTDATNLGQVKEMVEDSEKRMTNHVNKRERKLRAGIAGATAIATLPQATIPGANLVSAGVGSHNGQNAVAVGYSRLSDNGRVVLKLGASVNTHGGYNVGGAVGYQWK
ncbi:adhesin [Caviibacterium pharyngocola]|uniref:Adhesin n=1 Tax=Caviibacterium pharyngocola TaxID=28159 RepID=A0A2M8RT57_9PAST|nr:adhesin [Caviibacterium pharyngocola]